MKTSMLPQHIIEICNQHAAIIDPADYQTIATHLSNEDKASLRRYLNKLEIYTFEDLPSQLQADAVFLLKDPINDDMKPDINKALHVADKIQNRLAKHPNSKFRNQLIIHYNVISGNLRPLSYADLMIIVATKEEINLTMELEKS